MCLVEKIWKKMVCRHTLPWQLDSSERKGRQSAEWSQRLSSGIQPGEPSHTSSPSSHCSRAGGDRKRGLINGLWNGEKQKKYNLGLSEVHRKADLRQLYSSSPSGQSATLSQRSMEGRQLLFKHRYCPVGQPTCGGTVPGTWPGQDSSSDLSAQSSSPSHLQLIGRHWK